MESVIFIYKSMNAAVSVHLPHDCNYQNNTLNNSNSPKDGRSEGSEMIDKDVTKRRGGGSDSFSHDGSPLLTSEESNPRYKHQDWTAPQMLLFEFESDNNAGCLTPESQSGQAAKSLSENTASEQLGKGARKRVCVDSFIHDDSPLPRSQTEQLLIESLRPYDFQHVSDNDHTHCVKAHKHQELPLDTTCLLEKQTVEETKPVEKMMTAVQKKRKRKYKQTRKSQVRKENRRDLNSNEFSHRHICKVSTKAFTSE